MAFISSVSMFYSQCAHSLMKEQPQHTSEVVNGGEGCSSDPVHGFWP